jgi:hypothetical protein
MNFFIADNLHSFDLTCLFILMFLMVLFHWPGSLRELADVLRFMYEETTTFVILTLAHPLLSMILLNLLVNGVLIEFESYAVSVFQLQNQDNEC